MKRKKRRDGKRGRKRGTAPASEPQWRVDEAGRVYWPVGPTTVRHTAAEGTVTIRRGVTGRYYIGQVRTPPEEENNDGA